MTNQNGQNGCCHECGAPTKTVPYTPPGWGQTPSQRAVCTINQLHNVQVVVTLEALRLAHNGVISAQANTNQGQLTQAMSCLANLMSAASAEVIQAYSGEQPGGKIKATVAV